LVLSTLLRHGQKGAYVCLLWNMEYLHGPRPSGRMVIVLKSSFSSHDNRESIDAWRTLCYTQTYTHNCKNRSLKPLRMLIVSSSQSSYNPYEPGISPCLHFKLSKDPSFRPLSHPNVLFLTLIAFPRTLFQLSEARATQPHLSMRSCHARPSKQQSESNSRCH